MIASPRTALLLLLTASILAASPAAARQTGTIGGVITDAVTSLPLASTADTQFVVAAFSTAGAVVGSSSTDASGQYSISGIAAGTYFVKVIQSPGYVVELYDNIACVAVDCPVTAGTPVPLAAGASVTVNVALTPGGGFSGTVLRSDGTAVGGLLVQVFNASTSFVKDVFVGSPPNYVIDGLPPGSYFARVVPSGGGVAGVLMELYDGVHCNPIASELAAGCRIASGTPIAVAAGAITPGIDFSLDPTASIAGTVTAEGTGGPLAGVTVEAYAGDRAIAGGLTNASGQYTIGNLPPGTYRLRSAASTGNYINEWYGDICVGCAGTPSSVAVALGQARTGIDLALAAGGSIAGTISCEILFPSDWYELPTIYAYNSRGVLVRSSTFQSGSGFSCVSTFTSASYLIEGLPAGQYYLLARDRPFIPNRVFPSGGVFIDELYGDIPCVVSDCDVRRAVPVSVIVGATTGGIDFAMTQGASSGSVSLLSPAIRLFDVRGVELQNVVRASVGFVNTQSFTGVPPGTYYATWGERLNGGIQCPGCPPTAGRPIVIRPGDHGFSIAFGDQAAQAISGTVRDENGSAPLSTIRVEVRSPSGVLIGSAVTDLTGRYRVASLPTGLYYVQTLNDRGYVDELYPDVPCASCDIHAGAPVVVGSSEVTGIDFAIAAGGVVSGRVVDTMGVAVPSATVSVLTPAGVLAGRSRAAWDGAYRLTLPAGTYRARAEADPSHGAELYNERPCTGTGCDIAAATPVVSSAGAFTPNIDFSVASCGAMTMSPGILASAVIARPYRQVFTVSGGVAPIVFSLTSGTLPVGVTLDASGVLSGTPITPGHHELSVGALDASGCATARTLTLDVHACAFTLSPAGASVGAGGGNVTVTIGDPCGPQPVDVGNSFVTLLSNTLGQVVLSVAANPNAAARSATVLIGRRPFVVNQGGFAAQAPFGAFDAPLDGTQVSGSIAIGGWALDDLEVRSVQIYRDPVSGEVPAPIFLGTAVFVVGARPDVRNAYPGYPLNERAGWGFLILTNMLPNQGNGAFRLYAYAEDTEGLRTLLGARTIVATNSSSNRPFGAIDTPGQGGTIAGSSYINFGWALTPQPKIIPTDGSTIFVVVDGVPLGTATYNFFRADVSGLFPGLANSAGPVGYRAIDSTALAEGQHTLAWIVSDSQGAAAGIGSRYFFVANSADAQPPVQSGIEGGRRTGSLETTPVSDAVVAQERGSMVRQIDGTADGLRAITLQPMERLELTLGEAASSCPGTWAGYLADEDTLQPLPVGAAIDRAGIFYWQPGPGFGGTFDLIFVRTACDGGKTKASVRITIRDRR